MVLAPLNGSFDFSQAFQEAYQHEFGFLMDKTIMVDDVRVRGIGKTFDSIGPSVFSEIAATSFIDVGEEKVEGKTSIYFEQTGRVDVKVYLLEKLGTGDRVMGPAVIVDGTQTLVMDPGSESRICRNHVFVTLGSNGESHLLRYGDISIDSRCRYLSRRVDMSEF